MFIIADNKSMYRLQRVMDRSGIQRKHRHRRSSPGYNVRYDLKTRSLQNNFIEVFNTKVRIIQHMVKIGLTIAGNACDEASHFNCSYLERIASVSVSVSVVQLVNHACLSLFEMILMSCLN